MIALSDTLTRPARTYGAALRDMIADRDRSLSYETTPYRRMALQQERDRLATLLAEHEQKTGEAM